MASSISIKKQPDEIITVGIDFAEILGTATISSISSTSVGILGSDDASDLSILSSVIDSDADTINIKISGGTSGLSYTLTTVVVDSNGETLEGDGVITVKELVSYYGPLLIIRHLISDLSNDPEFSDNRLLDLFIVAAYQVNADLGLSYTVDLEKGTVTPDPTLSNDFINLTTLKSACILDRGAMRLASALEGIVARCGPAQLSVSGRMTGFKLLAEKGYCAAYDEAVKQYTFGNADFARGILSPFINEDFYPYSINGSYR